jgi:single-stranded DNA-binding protein
MWRPGEDLPAVSAQRQLVFLEGRLKTEKFEDKSGETKYYTNVVAVSMQMLDRMPEEGAIPTLADATVDYEA